MADISDEGLVTNPVEEAQDTVIGPQIVTEASYTEIPGQIRAIISGVVTFIPDDPENVERQLVAAWEAEGNVIQPYVVPPSPPITITADELFFNRMTDIEYEDLDASIKSLETARVYRGWSNAASFTEGTDLWALLVKHLDLVVTPTRKGELLARP